MHIDSVHVGLIVGIAGKAFIMLARSMPPLSPEAGYLARWFHDFIQAAASNTDKVGETGAAHPAPQIPGHTPETETSSIS